MDHELDYIASAYSTLRLNGARAGRTDTSLVGSPLKDISQNHSPSKLNSISPGKRSSAVIRKSPREIYKLCFNAIELGQTRLNKMTELSNSLVRLISSSFIQIYSLNQKDQSDIIVKRHQAFVVKLIELESVTLNFKFSSREITRLVDYNYGNERNEDNRSNIVEVLSSKGPMTVKFFVLQIIFKLFHHKRYHDAHIDGLLKFFLRTPNVADLLTEKQRPALLKLLLSFGKFAPSVQFKQCCTLKFLQLLERFELKFDTFITNLTREKFLSDLESELMSISDFGDVPFFLFEYAMNDKTQTFVKVTEHFQRSLSENQLYQTIDWSLVNTDDGSCKKLQKLLQMPHLNKEILWGELQHLGRPNAAIINEIGDFIIKNLDRCESSLQPIISYYIRSIENAENLDSSNFIVLDRFILNSEGFITSPAFIQDTFMELTSVFIRHKQFKRLKNISNLFFNFSGKLQRSEYTSRFLVHCLLVEASLFEANQKFSDFGVKFEKCIKALLIRSLPVREAFGIVYNNDFLGCFDSATLIHKLEVISRHFGAIFAFGNVKLLDLSHLSEENRALVFCIAAQFTTEDLIEFYRSLDINESILRMLSGCYYHQIPIVKPQNTHHLNSTTNADVLIKSFYYLTQEIRTNSTTHLKKIIHLYTQSWLSRNKEGLSQFEFELLKKLVAYLRFTGFQKSLKVVLISVQKYRCFESKPFNRWLEINEMENGLDLGEIFQVSIKLLGPIVYSESSVDDTIYNLNYLLLKLRYFLLNFDQENLLQTSVVIREILKKNMLLLSTENRTGLTKNKYLEVMQLLVKLCYFRGKALLAFGEHLESLLSFCNVIKISKSLLKQKADQHEVLSLISSSFRHIIKTLVHLGISKDASFYADELSKFNQSVSRCKPLFAYNNYFLCYYHYVVGNIESCHAMRLTANNSFESLGLIIENKYADNYKLIYYYLMSNVYSLSEEALPNAREKVKSFLNFMEREAKVLSFAWRQTFEYIFNSEISIKNTTNPYIVSMDRMAAARKLFIDAQSSLNHDPLFSTLEDSAMSIPSTYKEDNRLMVSPLKSRLKNVKNVKSSIMGLRQSKDIVLGLFDNLRYLSNYHINEIHKVLSLDLLTLSSISNSYNNECIEDSYKLNDYLKNQPLLNEKSMISITSQSDRASLIPNFNFAELGFSINELNQSTVDSELLTKLPNDLLVITIDICSFNGDLIISNFEKGSKTPNFLRLPISRHSSRTIDEDSVSFTSAIAELNAIIKKSNATTSKERTSGIHTPEQRRQWHKERHELDKSLEELLSKIEYCWIGGFKGIFNQEKISDEQIYVFREKFLDIIRQNVPSRSQKNQYNGSVKPVEIDDFVIKLFLKLGDPSKLSNTELLEDLIYFVLDILLFHGEENAYDEIDIDNIYVQVEKLISDYTQANPDPIKNKHTVLVLGKECLFIPWESLPCLRNTSTTRMPSLSNLLSLFNQNPLLCTNKRNGSFILNPSGDLLKTEERFADFQRVAKELNWKGSTGIEPSEKDFDEALDSDLFVYIGHGGGEQFIRSTTLKKRSKIAPTLLLGCSSASLKDNNMLEPSGTVYSYLIGGCPMIVGNLWDVTDKDIDKFSISLFEKWGLLGNAEQYPKVDICEAVRDSRDVCTLKYLNGAAPVVYGLPLSLL